MTEECKEGLKSYNKKVFGRQCVTKIVYTIEVRKIHQLSQPTRSYIPTMETTENLRWVMTLSTSMVCTSVSLQHQCPAQNMGTSIPEHPPHPRPQSQRYTLHAVNFSAKQDTVNTKSRTHPPRLNGTNKGSTQARGTWHNRP